MSIRPSFSQKNIPIQTFAAVNHYFQLSWNENLFKSATFQKMTYWTVIGARRRSGMRRRRDEPMQMTLHSGGATPGSARSNDLTGRSTDLAPPCLLLCFGNHIWLLYLFYFDSETATRGVLQKVGGANNWQRIYIDANPQRCPGQNTCLRTKSPRSWMKLHFFVPALKLLSCLVVLHLKANPGNLDILSPHDPYNQFTSTKVGRTCCHFGATRLKAGGV